jgi:2'-5' RNA ligase
MAAKEFPINSVGIMHPDCQAAATIYDDLWQKASTAFQAGQVQIDSYLTDRTTDRRRGITLVGRPDKNVCTRIERLQQELLEYLPGQYFYRPPEYHFTILSPFTATDQPEPFFARLGEYQEAIDQALINASRFSVLFEGITATPGAIMVQGFPQDSELNRIRESLRAVLGTYQLNARLETRYRVATAHITFIRFQTKPQNLPLLAEVLGRYRTMEFGVQVFQQVQLVKNDWYLSEDNLELLKEYTLA